MRKKERHHFLSLALLMLYVFSMLPATFFHQHHAPEVVRFAEASSCEKATYYGIEDEHDQHFSEAQESCWFCDHHLVHAQIPVENEFHFLAFPPDTELFAVFENYHFTPLLHLFNKDPPLG